MKKSLTTQSKKQDVEKKIFDKADILENLNHEFGKCPIQCRDKKIKNNKSPTGYNLETETYFNPSGNWGSSAIDAYKLSMKKITASEDLTLANEIIDRAVNAMPQTRTHEHNINTIHQALSDFEPKDTVEAKLCVQSSVLYAQGMQYLSRAESCSMMCQVDFYMKCAIKLLALHKDTIDPLSRYRRNGEQKVIIQHVNVSGDGKAIVGTIMTGGGG
jgi:hypothetical protein